MSRRIGFISAVATLVLSACGAPLALTGTGGEGLGSIQINLPGAGARSISQIDQDFAKLATNYFQIIAYENTGTGAKGHSYMISSDFPASGSASAGGGSITGVAAGTYTVLVLAGRKLASGSVVELAGACDTNVVVGASANTAVSLSLQNVLYELSGPSSPVAVNQPFTLAIRGDTGLPMIQVTNLVNWTGAAPDLNASTWTSGQAYSASLQFPGKATAGSYSVYLDSISLPLVFADADNGYTGYYSVVHHFPDGADWSLPSAALPDWESQYGSTVPSKVVVDFYEPGIVADLGWGPGRDFSN